MDQWINGGIASEWRRDFSDDTTSCAGRINARLGRTVAELGRSSLEQAVQSPSLNIHLDDVLNQLAAFHELGDTLGAIQKLVSIQAVRY